MAEVDCNGFLAVPLNIHFADALSPLPSRSIPFDWLDGKESNVNLDGADDVKSWFQDLEVCLSA